MPIVAWRFQCDPPPGNNDPDVTVFVTSSYTNDTTGETVTPKDPNSFKTVKLSALPAFLASPSLPEPTPPPEPLK